MSFLKVASETDQKKEAAPEEAANIEFNLNDMEVEFEK